MAKSLRSKRKRKMRAFKRIRYGEKELIRLENMISKTNEKHINTDINNKLIDSKEPNVNQFVKISLTQNSENKEKSIDKEVKMETSLDSVVKRSSKTLRNEFGNYPIWMNARNIKKHKNKLKLKRIQSKKK